MSNEDQGQCPLCGGPAELRTSLLKNYKVVQCEVCNAFRITSHAQHWLSQDKRGGGSQLSEKAKNAPEGCILFIDVESSLHPETHSVGWTYVPLES